MKYKLDGKIKEGKLIKFEVSGGIPAWTFDNGDISNEIIRGEEKEVVSKEEEQSANIIQEEIKEVEKQDWRKLKFFELKKYAEGKGMDIKTNTKKVEIEAYLVEREGQ